MPDFDVCEEIRRLEFEQFRQEVKEGLDLVAYIPNKKVSDDQPFSLKDTKTIMEKEYLRGYKFRDLAGFNPESVFIVEDKSGRESLWVSTDFKSYKNAYRRYWRDRLNLEEDPVISGRTWHIDHSFNVARLISNMRNYNSARFGETKLPNDGAAHLTPSKGVGYVRLFLITSRVNVIWGSSVERIRTAEGDRTVTALPASFLILSKIAGLEPPRSPSDISNIALILKQTYGLPRYTVEDMEYLISSDTSLFKNFHGLFIVESIDGTAVNALDENGRSIHNSTQHGLNAFLHDIESVTDYICSSGAGLERDFTKGEIGAVRRVLCEESPIFLDFIHDITNWPIIRIESDNGDWYGLEADGGRLFDARGYRDLDQLKVECLSDNYVTTIGGKELLSKFDFLVPSDPYRPFGEYWTIWKCAPCIPSPLSEKIMEAIPDDTAFFARWENRDI